MDWLPLECIFDFYSNKMKMGQTLRDYKSNLSWKSIEIPQEELVDKALLAPASG